MVEMPNLEKVALDFEGGIYVGEASNRVPLGQGTWILHDGTRYDGIFNGNNFSGNRTKSLRESSRTDIERLLNDLAFLRVEMRNLASEIEDSYDYLMNVTKSGLRDPHITSYLINEAEDMTEYADDIRSFAKNALFTGKRLDAFRAHPDGSRYTGELRNGKPWNGTDYDEVGRVIATYSQGIREEQTAGQEGMPN